MAASLFPPYLGWSYSSVPSGALHAAKTRVVKQAKTASAGSARACQGKPCWQDLLRGFMANSADVLYQCTGEGGQNNLLKLRPNVGCPEVRLALRAVQEGSKLLTVPHVA